MKKLLLYSYLFLLTLTLDASESTLGRLTKIDCECTPYYRGRNVRIIDEANVNTLIRKGTSNNWSGYAVATDLQNPAPESVTQVIGSWVVPQVTPMPMNSFSSAWVGIDGYSNGTVQQIGTEHDWLGGRAYYIAWFELFPRDSFSLSGFPLNPGDVITAEVKYIKKNTYQLQITNETKGVYTIVPTNSTHTSKPLRSSAEWIVEAPSAVRKVLPLADFGDIAFSNCACTINGISGSIDNSNWKHDVITMEKGGVVEAVPSGLFSGGSAFSITWVNN